MIVSSRSRFLPAALSLFTAAGLLAIGILAQDKLADDAKDSLGGSKRALAFVSTDKPMYKIGENVWGRAVVVDAHAGAPLKAVFAIFKVLSPKGEEVFSLDAGVGDFIAPFNWKVPPAAAGGEYTLRVEFPAAGFAPSERKFDVRAYRPPRFRSQIRFLKNGYGPGEKVTATLTATRAAGGVPEGAEVVAIARVDGEEVARKPLKFDAKGDCVFEFPLPEKIEEGDGTLAFLIMDGGVQETAAKSIPIVLNRVKLAFFPEGGDMVSGLPCRVYFEARDRSDKPADVTGRVLSSSGSEAAVFSADHEGRGSFEFAPAGGETYVAELSRPAGNTQKFLLPDVKDSGYSLFAVNRVFGAGGSMAFKVRSTAGGDARIALFRHEKEISSVSLKLDPVTTHVVTLTPPSSAHGVLRATLFDSAGAPKAERLVFRRPEGQVRVGLKCTPDTGSPGSAVTIEMQTTDTDGKPVAAVLCIAVTDDAVLEQIETREQAPRLPEQLLLESEIRELRDSKVYLGFGRESETAMDLLLGTQGWRRFAFVSVPDFLAAYGDQAKRAIAWVDQAKVLEWRRKNEENLKGGWDGGPGEGRRFRGMAKEDEQDGGAPPAAADPGIAGAEPDQGQGQDDLDDALGLLNEEKKDQGAEDKNLRDAEEDMPEKAKDAKWARRELKEEAISRRAAIVRVYAHAPAPKEQGAARNDFTETVYWNAGLSTDKEGKAEVKFQLSDSITSFRVMVDAIGLDGALGSADALIVSRKPFYIEPKLPLEITAGDLVDAPVAVFNGTDAAFEAKIKAALGAGLILEGAEPTIGVGPGKSGRVYLALVGGQHNGAVEVALTAAAGGHSDSVTRTIPVAPYGFPVEYAFGGKLSSANPGSGVVAIPQGMVAASLSVKAAVYPSPLATLTEALKGLLREPSGCFEQTSSSAYPNIMVMNYYQSHHVNDVALMDRTRGLIDAGYKKLTSFECSEKGYEWFGGNPGHEALSAYGVMEFHDMAKVYSVDADMLARTRGWLLARRDGKGGFKRNARALDSFGGAPDDITNAYIVWALLEAGEKGLEAEIAAVKAMAQKSEDPYVLALAANVLLLAGDETAEAVCKKVASKQAADGSVQGAATSITRSGGDGLLIETTSLAVLAWLKSGKWTSQVEKAAEWVYAKCKGGRFGSTQSTVLALKAILGYDASRAKPSAPGTIVLLVDGNEVSRVPFGVDTTGPIEITGLEKALTPGSHKVEVKMIDGSEMPFAVDVSFKASTPANDDACKVAIETLLSSKAVAEGEALEAKVKLLSRSEEGLPMTLAIVGLPGGLEPRHDQLKELVKQGKIDFYEVIGREVVLYWRCLEPMAVKDVTLSLIAAVPGQYRGPASRAYLYYTDELKHWCPGLDVKVRRAGE